MKWCEKTAHRAAQWAAWALLLAMGLAFAVAKALPPQLGWENHGFEWAQNVGLFAAGVAALWQAHRLNAGAGRALMWIAALFWFVFVGREMSWGAVLLSPSSWSEHAGPIWSSRTLLWYRPAVPWVVGSLLLLAIGLGVRHGVWHALAQLWQRKQLPWAALALFVLAFALASQAEGKGGAGLAGAYGMHAVVLEEILETLGYLALWLAQVQVFWALRSADGTP